jgi:drug/metabolite transporter (DMT)-like permease
MHHFYSSSVPGAIGYLVIVGSVLIFIAFIYALQKLPPEISSIYAYINPLWASLKTTEQPKDNSDIYSFK